MTPKCGVVGVRAERDKRFAYRNVGSELDVGLQVRLFTLVLRDEARAQQFAASAACSG